MVPFDLEGIPVFRFEQLSCVSAVSNGGANLTDPTICFPVRLEKGQGLVRWGLHGEARHDCVLGHEYRRDTRVAFLDIAVIRMNSSSRSSREESNNLISNSSSRLATSGNQAGSSHQLPYPDGGEPPDSYWSSNTLQEPPSKVDTSTSLQSRPHSIERIWFPESKQVS